MSERFAIYYAPDVQGELWQVACEWLGRDAFEQRIIERPQQLERELSALTSSPARYGFHATLKPPMRLAPKFSETTVLNLAQQFAQGNQSVSIGTLRLKSLHGFLALVPDKQSEALGRFAGEVVQFFEPLRAQLNRDERKKRMASPLTSRQLEYLNAYGYPYVFDEFRLHLTLSNRVDQKTFDRIEAIAKNHFAPALATNYSLDRICVFRESDVDQPFERIADFPLKSSLNEKV